MIKHFNTVNIGTLGILRQMNRRKVEIFIGSSIILMKGWSLLCKSSWQCLILQLGRG